MTVSEKQLQANKKNAQKGGVKTPEGKEIVKYNALKHGLLAKEVFIPVGEGAENSEEFNTLLAVQLTDKVSHILPEMDEDTTFEPKEMRELLNTQAKWSDDQIWQAYIELCDDRIKHHREQIASFEKQKVKNKLKLQVIKKLGNIPSEGRVRPAITI